MIPFLICLLAFLNTLDASYGLYSIQCDISHTEGSGIGYRRGYTTLEGFFMGRDCEKCSCYPFLDVRGQGFNNRKMGANFGAGVRYLSSFDWIYGINLWYDLRQGDHRDLNSVGHCFHQAGIGFEAIGPIVDFRFNFYQPVGKKSWSFQQFHFNDHKGITPIISYKKTDTFRMCNAEIGGYIGCGTFCCCIDWKIYLATGPYLLQEHCHAEKWGVNLRLKADLTPYWSLEVRTGYDQLFLGSLQVKLMLQIPLYPLSSMKKESWIILDCFRELITQPIERFEIMPLRTFSR